MDGPVYKDLVEFMGFDPGLPPPACHWDPWLLDETYPPTVGELAGSLAESLQPKLIGDSTDE